MRGPPWHHEHPEGHHGRWRRHGRPPVGWLLARGIHRSLVFYLLAALALGGVGGTLLARGTTAGVCVAVGLFFTIWPLSWAAAMRIAWPLRELATVAGEIRKGKLASREDLPDDARGEVGEVAGALRGVTDRVARQLGDQRALLAAVSHELRSPLGRARVLVELLREGSAPPDAHDLLQGEIDAMDQLVGDLLTAARIDFEAVSPTAVDAELLARRALDLARLPADTLVCDTPAGPVRADPTLIVRALASVLDNARRYGATTVRLHLRGRATRVRFEVEDDGPGFGVDPEQAFAPFWRGTRADGTTPPPGEGLGLALVRQIAQAHGGEAGAENRAEGGARVWVELPRS